MTFPSSVPAGKSPVSGETPVTPVTATPEITIQEFQRLSLRTGTILTAEIHPQADRLLVIKVDIGEPEPRQVVAGIRSGYQPENLIGKQVVVVANLKTAVLRGIESRGMILAATDATAGIVLLALEKPVAPGSTVK